MNEDIRKFLQRFSAEELVAQGILRRHRTYSYLLDSRSLRSLFALMHQHGITRLEAPEHDWFLTVDRQFSNLGSEEAKHGDVEDLSNPIEVFNWQNLNINPFYEPTGPIHVFGRRIDPDQGANLGGRRWSLKQCRNGETLFEAYRLIGGQLLNRARTERKHSSRPTYLRP